ncbi:MAG: hypothetical protein GY835_11580 [bacterium]|nr:hypothetical protein [bacterium]
MAKVDLVSLALTRAEALVLFEWLTRLDSAESLPCEDHAEQLVLWSLEGQLEKILTEPLAADYKDLLAEARQMVRSTGA